MAVQNGLAGDCDQAEPQPPLGIGTTTSDGAGTEDAEITLHSPKRWKFRMVMNDKTKGKRAEQGTSNTRKTKYDTATPLDIPQPDHTLHPHFPGS